jgi:hypothetical protein
MLVFFILALVAFSFLSHGQPVSLTNVCAVFIEGYAPASSCSAALGTGLRFFQCGACLPKPVGNGYVFLQCTDNFDDPNAITWMECSDSACASCDPALNIPMHRTWNIRRCKQLSLGGLFESTTAVRFTGLSQTCTAPASADAALTNSTCVLVHSTTGSPPPACYYASAKVLVRPCDACTGEEFVDPSIGYKWACHVEQDLLQLTLRRDSCTSDNLLPNVMSVSSFDQFGCAGHFTGGLNYLEMRGFYTCGKATVAPSTLVPSTASPAPPTSRPDDFGALDPCAHDRCAIDRAAEHHPGTPDASTHVGARRHMRPACCWLRVVELHGSRKQAA